MTAPHPRPKVVVASDHGGLPLKDELVASLRQDGFDIMDCGVYTPDPVDYPDMAALVAQLIARDSHALGIIVDGAGVGSAMTANKIPGVRAAACYDTFTARNSREHNNANVLTLGGRVTAGGLALEIARVFLSTTFGGGRHARRVEKIMQIEACYARPVECS